MLFVFRGIRMFQVLAAILCLVLGLGAVLCVLGVSQGNPILIVGAVIFGLGFLWAFSVCLRAPTSFVAVAEERTRIRFAGFIDTVVPNNNILGAKLVRWPIWGGIGVRTNFNGHVALASMWGDAIELELREPVQVWVLPKLWRVKARRLTVSIRNGHKLVDRFGAAPAASSPRLAGARKMKRRGSRTR